jgi:hypothetical protein
LNRFLFILLFFIQSIVAVSQPPQRTDTTKTSDSTTSISVNVTDSIRLYTSLQKADRVITKIAPDTSYYKLFGHPYLPGKSNALHLTIKERARASKDQLFYIVAALMLLLAFIKLVFGKYFHNIFRLFFQPTFRQKQTREQLLQNNFPSLLYNFFFILSSAVYVALLIQYFHPTSYAFVWLFLYAAIFLTVLYFFKYIFLVFAGWVFNVKEAAETYVFVVYLINKILGILLVPFILIMAFSKAEFIHPTVTISMIIVGLLFLYRYVISFAPVGREIKVSAWHFFFYVLAFEIVPFLLIYKLLAVYLLRTL